MRWLMSITVVVMAACLGASQTTTGKSDLDALQGVWKLASGEMGGIAMPPEITKDVQLTIKGSVSNYKEQGTEHAGSFKLDEAKKPKHIDITDQKTGMVMIGIYELKGDEFKVCLDGDGKTRPTEFKSKEDNPSVGIMVFKREKK